MQGKAFRGREMERRGREGRKTRGGKIEGKGGRQMERIIRNMDGDNRVPGLRKRQ